jgi:hypothetical protein
MDALRTLEILITSRTPLIAIETLEEERVAQRLKIPLFVWTMTRGLRRAADERRQIFAIHLTRRYRDPAGFDLGALAAASKGFSGGEIEQAVVAALYTAFARRALLSTEHILEELKATKPLSVTRAEEVEDLREWARGRAVPAS